MTTFNDDEEKGKKSLSYICLSDCVTGQNSRRGILPVYSHPKGTTDAPRWCRDLHMMSDQG